MNYLIHRNTESGIIRRQKNTFQTKEEHKTSEKELNKMEINSLSNKKSKVIAVTLLSKLGRKMDKHSENFNKKKIQKSSNQS